MKPNILLTLIQTSQDRKEELTRFIMSLNDQVNIEFNQIQLIFIDQGDNRETFKELNSDIEFLFIKIDQCSLSKARNIGLQYVKGEYVCFPDDDCWYDNDTLSIVLSDFGKDVDGLSYQATNEDSILIIKYPSKQQYLTLYNWCATCSITFFLKFKNDIRFDENMGLGSPYNFGSGEETDYYLTYIEKYNYKILYQPHAIIHHPLTRIFRDKAYLNKCYSYGRGCGYLYKKHKYGVGYVLKNIIRPFIGSIYYLIKGDIYNSRRSLNWCKGRIEGYFFKI